MRLALIALVLYAAPAFAQTVICTKPDGSKYVGMNPPEGCSTSKSLPMTSVIPEGKSEADGAHKALAACQHAVTNHLKSPGSAQFPNPAIEAQGGWRYDIGGHVDSQNPMGGLMRSAYFCETSFVGRDTWRISLRLVASDGKSYSSSQDVEVP